MERAPRSSPEADAAHRMAMYAAEGAGVAQDWAAALGHLQRSAELGSRLAQAELAGLSGRWALAHDILVGEASPELGWSRLCSFVDLAKWLVPPRKQILSVSPRVAAVDDFTLPEMCDWLIARARPRMSRAKVYDHDTGGPRSESVRTNSECHFLREDSDLVLAILRARIASVTELPVHAMEATAVLHYLVGQEFLPHFDFLNSNSPGYAKDVAERGQRVLTFLLCLNDDYEGGETEFPALGKRWKGRKGSALFFWNV